MRILSGFLAVFCLITCGISQEPRVSHFDDFLGARLLPGNVVSLAGTGVVRIAEGHTGGVVLLAALGNESGAARLRFGEEPVTGAFNALNFSAKKNLVFKTRVYMNRDTHVQATIGFVGFHDPRNVLAIIFDSNGEEQVWGFQVVNETVGVTIPTGFTHRPGSWFTVRIETEWGETPIARVYFNDEEEPRAEVSGEYLPISGLCTEHQIWNKPLEGAHSQPTMWVDYLSVNQDR